MELRHLRSFLALAKQLNFTRAAGEVHLTQPALTKQIQALEREVGDRLFDRSTRQVRLTEAGEIFLPHAENLTAAADDALAAIRYAVDGRPDSRSCPRLTEHSAVPAMSEIPICPYPASATGERTRHGGCGGRRRASGPPWDPASDRSVEGRRPWVAKRHSLGPGTRSPDRPQPSAQRRSMNGGSESGNTEVVITCRLVVDLDEMPGKCQVNGSAFRTGRRGRPDGGISADDDAVCKEVLAGLLGRLGVRLVGPGGGGRGRPGPSAGGWPSPPDQF